MIYHIFNGRVLHLTPGLIENTIKTSKVICKKQDTQHFFCVIMIGDRMLYRNVNENPYIGIFRKYNHTNYSLIYEDKEYYKLMLSLKDDDRIIYHSNPLRRFFIFTNSFFFLFRRKLLNHSSFVCWGGDYLIYDDTIRHKITAYVKRLFFNRYHTIIALSYDDQAEVKKMYPKATVICANYAGPIRHLMEKTPHDKFHVVVSHSGWPHNNHIHSFDLLKRYAGKIMITCPLCYGNPTTIENIINKGKEIFGNDFHYFKDLKSKEEYAKFMSGVDAYVTSAEVQTGLGAVGYAMLGGAKIFVKSNLYNFFSNRGCVIYNTESIANLSLEQFTECQPREYSLKNVDILNSNNKPDSENFKKWQKIYEE